MQKGTALPGWGELEWLKVDDLRPHKRNARTHTRKQITQIADSIRRFGFTSPVLVDEHSGIIAGHGRVEAARLLKLGSVPVRRTRDLTEAEKRAYIVADNRLAELAGWDRELLGLEIGEILALEPEFNIDLIGFDPAEIEALLNGVDESETREVAAVIDEKGPVISSVGDLWLLGDHRLICGDATSPEVFARLMDGAKAQMVFTDPPYNVPVNGHICGLGKVQHDEFVMAAGEMSEPEFTAFLAKVMKNLVASSSDGSIHFHCMDWRHMQEILAAGREAYTELKNLIVWNKDNGGMGSFYRSKHELVFAFKNGSAPHINNFSLGQHGRYRTNVWDYAGVNSLTKERSAELAMHPTVKPVAMVVDAMKDCSKRGGIVLDAFSGSGTTIMAAEQCGRRGYAVELDPKYVDVAVRRWQKLTGKQAVLEGCGTSFAETEAFMIN